MSLQYLSNIERYFTNIKQAVKLATYWNNMLHMSAQCYEHRFGYCTNAKTCFNVHFRPILAERRVLLWRHGNVVGRVCLSVCLSVVF